MHKKISLLSLFIFSVLLLSGCSGSKTIRGTWQAVDGTEKQYTIRITQDQFMLEGDGQSENHTYKQTAVGIQNGIRYYGLTMNGQKYALIFPEKKQKLALWVLVTGDDYLVGKMVFAMNQNEQPNFATYYQKYFSATN